MVKIGFIVEGATEKIFIESAAFQNWANAQGIAIYHPALNANGGGNLLPKNIEPMVQQLRGADCIVILTDLEHETTEQAVLERITTQYTSLIFIAVKAFEAWFLADSHALAEWLNMPVSDIQPEQTLDMPWHRLKELAKDCNARGTGELKTAFAKRMMTHYGFSLERAAQHPHCPSAKKFHDGLLAIAQS